MKSHGEIAIKGLTNYVYDDDDSIQFPSREHSVSEQVCACKETKTKEETATPKTIGSLKQDHWILDKKNKQLIRVHITPRKALFTPTGTKECPVNPDNISRGRTTEIIDASEGGDPEMVESQTTLRVPDSWGLELGVFGYLILSRIISNYLELSRIISKMKVKLEATCLFGIPESIAKGSSVRGSWTSYTEPSCTEPSCTEPSYIEPSYIEPST